MASLTERIIRSFLQRREQGIPREVRHKTVMHILDEVGIALAARVGAPAAPEAVKAMYLGARGDCQVIGGGDGLPPALAAFANASLCHAMDYDDINDACHGHMTSTTFPAALAAADLTGASGDVVVEAVALGGELMCRLGLFQDPVGDERMYGADYFLAQVHGYFGAALSAGIVLGLTEEELVSAFGLAFMQVAGAKEAGFGLGSDARAIYPGFGAMGGVHAALLAKAGVTGPRTAFDGPAGLYRVVFRMPLTEEKIDRLLQTDDWDFLDTKMKPFPCCRSTQQYVAAAQLLREQVRLDRIEKIVVEVKPQASALCTPLEARRRPETLQDAKYSIPFMVGFALAHGEVTLQNMNVSVLEDPEALRLAALVECVFQPARTKNPPGYISITSDGVTIDGPRLPPPGVPADKVRDKFLDCCGFAGIGEQGPELYDRLLGIEGATVSDLMAGITLPGASAQAGAARVKDRVLAPAAR